MRRRGLRIALGKRFRSCPSFCCLSVRPNWEGYAPEEREQILAAGKVFYPSPIYEDVLQALGKDVFPRNYYRFMGNKIRQSDLFRLLGISHPRTRLYYGGNRQERILADFEFPFVAKTATGSSKGEGVYLIRGEVELQRYLDVHLPAYIQEYLPIERDLRVVLIAGRVVHAYWRIHPPGDFRNNVSQGASISYCDIPEAALDFARDVAIRCRFDEVGLDVCFANDRYYVIEANMVFGREGFRKAGLDFYGILAQMDREGFLE